MRVAVAFSLLELPPQARTSREKATATRMFHSLGKTTPHWHGRPKGIECSPRLPGARLPSCSSADPEGQNDLVLDSNQPAGRRGGLDSEVGLLDHHLPRRAQRVALRLE